CLRTAASGEDGTHLYRDPELIGHVYVGPYLAHSPEFAFVLEDGQGVCGYVLGVLDSRAFARRLEREWWPSLRAQYPAPQTPPAERTPDERATFLIHSPEQYDDPLLRDFPSHLHIDLLPRGQGAGQGRRLMETLLDALRQAGSPGVHLGVGGQNTRAQGFYRHLGFEVLRRWEGGGALMGYRLSTSAEA
ncbi:MAG: GNAT family N-acetyltransferase, partial [Deinococcus sp.]|uniref:GNAT family N-acetyltransferase n=1 Tax=Deinococcus sp. TaxID=47478 RepID=UPI0026DADEEC